MIVVVQPARQAAVTITTDGGSTTTPSTTMIHFLRRSGDDNIPRNKISEFLRHSVDGVNADSPQILDLMDVVRCFRVLRRIAEGQADIVEVS